MKSFQEVDFARCIGLSAGQLHPAVCDFLNSHNFRYRVIEGLEYQMLVRDILMVIEKDSQKVGAMERRERWQDGWTENLLDYSETGDMGALVPKFIRPGRPLRLFREYIYPEDANFELNFVKLLQVWLAHHHVVQFSNVYEFGCGTGFNIAKFAEIFPGKNYFGSDFVQSSVDLVNKIGETSGLKVKGDLFDMRSPSSDYLVLPDSFVCTFGAIEQLAGDFDQFFEYLLTGKASLVAHIEPSLDLYETSSLSDLLAYKFQDKRGYSRQVCGRLRELEKGGRLRLRECRRLGFGSLFMEGYNFFLWERAS